MTDTIVEQLKRGELAERQVQTLLAGERSLLLEIERLRAENEQLRAALHAFLALPQGCDCRPESGCGIAKAREGARRALEEKE